MNLPIPTHQQAEEYVRQGANNNPGNWVDHVHYAAQGAEIIAKRYPGLDPDRAYVLGLLHDIGRRYGSTGMRHILDGYHFLANEGYEGAARICLTHPYPVEGEIVGASKWDGSPQEFTFVRNYLEGIQYDDYDRLIQLCDALCLPNGFCLLEKRLLDVAMRYGVNEHTINRWKGFFAVKARIEQAIGVSVYRLLPGVVETTFEWDRNRR